MLRESLSDSGDHARRAGQNQVSVPSFGHNTRQRIDQIVDELPGARASMILKMVFRPLMSHSGPQFRTGFPDLFGHRAEIHAKNSCGRRRSEKNGVMIVVVSELHEVVKTGGGTNRHPVRHWNAELQRKEERLSTAAGEHRHSPCPLLQPVFEKLLDCLQSIFKCGQDPGAKRSSEGLHAFGQDAVKSRKRISHMPITTDDRRFGLGKGLR